MKILMLGWELAPHISGGLGVVCSSLARSLTEHGTEVLFVLPRARGDEQAGNAEVRGCNVAGRAETRLTGESIDSALRPYQTRAEYDRQRAALPRSPVEPDAPFLFRGGYGATLIDEVTRFAEVVETRCTGEEFDVIHAHDWMTYAAGLKLKARTGRPLVCHVHSSERDRRPFEPDPEIERKEQDGFDGADRIVCVSDFAARALSDHYRVDADKLRTVHNALDSSDAERGEGPPAAPGRAPRVLFLGRLTEQKGPLTFLEAAARVLTRLPEAEIVVGGEGDLLEDCVRRAEELGIQASVRFTGFVEGDEVERMYRESDVYVMPSVSEPFGLTALEALSCGVPVLVCRQSGAAEVLPNSVQFDHWNVEDLARKILAVLRFPSLREQLVAAGRADLHALGWDASALLLHRVYEEVLA